MAWSHDRQKFSCRTANVSRRLGVLPASNPAALELAGDFLYRVARINAAAGDARWANAAQPAMGLLDKARASRWRRASPSLHSGNVSHNLTEQAGRRFKSTFAATAPLVVQSN